MINEEIAKSDPKYKSVERVMKPLQIIIEISILASIIYKIILDLKKFLGIWNFKEFSIATTTYSLIFILNLFFTIIFEV
ncbi:MAG: hypothetical protein K6343_06590 [Caldisericaceae bacterium]